jgi:hypothetical protein
MSRNQAVIVEYTHDEYTDMFQVCIVIKYNTRKSQFVFCNISDGRFKMNFLKTRRAESTLRVNKL